MDRGRGVLSKSFINVPNYLYNYTLTLILLGLNGEFVSLRGTIVWLKTAKWVEVILNN